ncbi:OB-fold protein [Aquimarina rubra]|uniref:tRNA_anti-like n=1 Tax=Aquimarina rubra TaxID=1920033 RepID=A0ABW5LEX4_9FLAO
MKRKTRITFVISILIIALAGMFIYTAVYNKPHIDVSVTTPNISLEAGVLLDEFLNNETEANTKYLDQIVEISGMITEITTNKDGNGIITLSNENSIGNVLCHLSQEESKKLSNLKTLQKINIKGICTGYLMDVILVKCVIVN